MEKAGDGEWYVMLFQSRLRMMLYPSGRGQESEREVQGLSCLSYTS